MSDTLTKEDIQALVKDAFGEMRAEMRSEAEALSKSLEEQFGSVEVAKRLGQETDILNRLNAAPDGSYVKPSEKSAWDEGLVGKFFRDMADQKVNHGAGPELALKNIAETYKDVNPRYAEAVTRVLDNRVNKVMALADFSAGGALVPDEFANEVIPILYSKAILTELGVTRVPMPNGTLTMPYGDTGHTAGWVGEVETISVSEPTTGQISMSARKLANVVLISNDHLRTPSSAIDRFVQQDLVNGFVPKVELGLLRGTGAGQPKGITQFISDDASRVNTQSGTALADKVSDLFTLIQNVLERDIPMNSPGFAFDIRTEFGIKSTLDADGNFVFRDEMNAGMLLGYRYRSTTNLPNNLGGGGNTAQIIFADWAQFLVGETTSMEIVVRPDAAYYDGAAVQSGLSNDVTPIRALIRLDSACRFRGKEGEILDAVTWSA